MSREQLFLKWFYISLVLWAISLFSSITLIGFTHIVMLPPVGYFIYRSYIDGNLQFSASAQVLMLICLVAVVSIAFNVSEIHRPLKSMTRIKYYVMGFAIIPALNYSFQSFLNRKRIRILIN